MFVYNQNFTNLWWHEFVCCMLHSFHILKYNSILFVTCSWGCKFLGKGGGWNFSSLIPPRTVMIPQYLPILNSCLYWLTCYRLFKDILNKGAASPSAFEGDDGDDFKQPANFRTPGAVKQVDIIYLKYLRFIFDTWALILVNSIYL